MRVAIFGKKFKNDLSNFVSTTTKVLIDKGIKDSKIDTSYFETKIDEDSKNVQSVYKKIEKIILRSDAVIIEATSRSDGIGFITGFSLARNKSTLILYDSNKRKEVDSFSSIIQGSSKLKRSFVSKYDNEISLKNEIENFVVNAQGMLDSPFNAILSGEHHRYLEWYSYTNKVAKVERLRELISQDIENNQSWQSNQI